MYTTSQVADLLQLTSKKVLLYSKKGKLKLEKSSNGSYLYSEEQFKIIKEIHEATITPNEAKQDIHDFSSRMNHLSQKVVKIEEALDTKANEVVSVQILEHRREIEDLKKIVTKLNEQVENLNENINTLKTELEDQKKIVAFKPKKRFAILSIFGM